MTDLNVSELIEKASSEKSKLLELKSLLVSLKCYAQASEVREVLAARYPETDEMKAAKEAASNLSLVFRMVDLSISDHTCHLISETLKKYQKKKGKFDINDATDLMCTTRELFQLKDPNQ